jgi:Peptidase family C25/Propeptide_C25/FG-GAP-like repeat
MKIKHHSSTAVQVRALWPLILSMLFVFPETVLPGTGDLNILKDSSNTIEVHLAFPSLELADIQGRDAHGDIGLKMEGCDFTREGGKPALPTFIYFLQVPDGVRREHIEVSSSRWSTRTLEEIDISSLRANEGSQADSIFYSSNNFWPDQAVSIKGPFSIRDTKFIVLTCYPVVCNPASRLLEITSEMRVKITFSGGPERLNRKGVEGKSKYFSESTRDRLGRSPFDAVLGSFIKNYRPSVKTAAPEIISRGGKSLSSESGADYLIIAADRFCPRGGAVDSLTRLIEAKEKKGLKVRLVPLAEIRERGLATREKIAGYIQNAYDNWTTAPTYVLLVGDVEHIPTFYTPSDSNPPIPIATDLYYTTMDWENEEKDYLSDLMLGRLPASDHQELKIMVDKILQRENISPIDDFFYQALLTVDDEGATAKGSINSFADYLENEEGCRVFRVFAEGGSHLTAISAINEGVFRVFAEEKKDLTERTISAINEGVFLVAYNGHGGPNGSADPNLLIRHIPQMKNKGAYPVFIAMACYMGLYDTPGGHLDGFGEALLKAPDRGAAGFIGSTRASLCTALGTMLRAYFKAAWMDDSATTKLGPLLNMGRLSIYASSNDPMPEAVRMVYEAVNLLGDPEMDLYPGGNLPFQAKIDQPQGGPVKDLLQIMGTADGERYTIELGDGVPASKWELLTAGESVKDGMLGKLETSGYPDGAYSLRLTVTADGKIACDRSIIEIDNVCFSSPEENGIYDRDDKLPVKIQVPADAQSCALAYAAAAAPEEWHDLGCLDRSASELFSGELDLSGLEVGKVYILRAVVPYGEVESTAIVSFQVEDFQKGWESPPVLEGNVHGCHPIACDLDGDGTKEVIVGASKDSGQIYSAAGEGIMDINGSYTAVGDIDGNGVLEVIQNRGEDRVDAKGLNNSYSKIWTFSGRINSSPVCADIDGNGAEEIIISTKEGRLFVLELDEQATGITRLLIEVAGGCDSSPAVADINHDGRDDIVFTSYSTSAEEEQFFLLHVVDGRTGNYLDSWHGARDLPAAGRFGYGSPVIGDLENDGKLEICLAGNECGSPGGLLVFNHDGSLRFQKDDEYYAHPILADYDRDGTLEIIAIKSLNVFSEKIALLGPSGESIREIPFPGTIHLYSYPCVADVDGNGSDDVVIANSDGELLAYDLASNDISPLPGWPKYLPYFFASTPAIADLDGDGDLEMVATDWGGMIRVYDLNGNGSPEWPMFQHDARHTGFYGSSSNTKAVMGQAHLMIYGMDRLR